MSDSDEIVYEPAEPRRQSNFTPALLAREAEQARRERLAEEARAALRTRAQRKAEEAALAAALDGRKREEARRLLIERQQQEAASRAERERLAADEAREQELCDDAAKEFEAVSLPALNKAVEDADAEAGAAARACEQLQVEACATEEEAARMPTNENDLAVARVAVLEPALRLARRRAEIAREVAAAAAAKRDRAVNNECARRTFVRLHQLTAWHRDAAKAATVHLENFRLCIAGMLGAAGGIEKLLNAKLPGDVLERSRGGDQSWSVFGLWRGSKTRAGTDVISLVQRSGEEIIDDVHECLETVERLARHRALQLYGYAPDAEGLPTTLFPDQPIAPPAAEPAPREGGDISNSFVGGA